MLTLDWPILDIRSVIDYPIVMRCIGEVERLDALLASFAPAETALRLRLGQALEVLARGGHFELGFSSMATASSTSPC
jgi:hypothetical protein